jgi:hypothetical protein
MREGTNWLLSRKEVDKGTVAASLGSTWRTYDKDMNARSKTGTVR